MNRTEESFSKKMKKSPSMSNLNTNTNSKSFLNSIPFAKTESSDSDSNTNSNSTGNLIAGYSPITIILIILLIVFPAIGIVTMAILGNVYENVTEVTSPIILNFLKLFGYSAGTIINKSADVAGDVAKLGIDIAEGSIQNVGNLVQGKPGNNNDLTNKGYLDETIEKKLNEDIDKKIANAIDKKLEKTRSESNYKKPTEVKDDSSDNTIQKPISSDKMGWCLIGEYQNKRGCVSVSESDQCLSGQIFPSKEMCLNPTLTP